MANGEPSRDVDNVGALFASARTDADNGINIAISIVLRPGIRTLYKFVYNLVHRTVRFRTIMLI